MPDRLPEPTSNDRRGATISQDEIGRRPGRLDRIRANPTGRIVLKVAVGTLGSLLVVIGLILVPLPGPGWLIVIAGLAVLAIEFAWARHALTFTRRQLRRWTRWLMRRSWPIRAAVGAAGMLLVAVIVWASVRLSFGVDLVATARHHLPG